MLFGQSHGLGMGWGIFVNENKKKMIKTLYDIGKALSEMEQYEAYFEPWENPFPSSEGAKVIVVRLKDGQVLDVRLENFSTGKVSKYLYRTPPGANGTNLVPTFRFYVATVADEAKWEVQQKTNLAKLMKKVRASIKNQQHDFLLPDEVERLEEMLLSKSRELSKDNPYLLTMTIDGKYFGDFKAYRDLFEEEAYAKYHKKSSAQNKVCSVTYEEVPEVWGRVDTLGFTVNDIAFSRSGFSGKHSYRMLPVGPEVVRLLEGSRKLVMNEVRRNFYQLRYLVLPRFNATATDLAKRKVIKWFFRSTRDSSFEDTGSSIINNEKILHAITEQEELQDNVSYDILFYEQNQAQFLIKLQMSDVLPSRLKQVFVIKQRVEKTYRSIVRRVYKDPKTKVEKAMDYRITFAGIKDFFSKKVKTDYIYHPYFFKIVEAVFQGVSLNEQQVYRAFVKRIRLDYKQRNEDGKSNTYARRTKDAFVIYQYFLQLGLFKNQILMEEQDRLVATTAQDFIKQHAHFFTSEYKRGVFSLGSLTAYLMSKQYRKLKSTPFMKQLNNLNIDEKTVVKLVPKLINKLREYNTAVPDLEQRIAEDLMKPHRLSKDEISYAFTLGLVMQREFAKAYKENKEKEKKAESEDMA